VVGQRSKAKFVSDEAVRLAAAPGRGRLKAQHEAGVPIFRLNNVEDFDLRRSPGLADTNVKKVSQKEL
jgi:hypothetical protein